MAFNLRLLLVAAIFLSNCITWTTSRHHFTHNISGQRSRHRRQGAGLFLPASFVIPGGEGNGEGWGEWGPVSPCSRTCGGGVASQKRICLHAGADGLHCTGGDTKYFSCETQDCPKGSIDFRAQQCSEFNDKHFRGALYEWIPFTEVKNPCELNCIPRGGHFYYRHVDKVIDGTKCDADSFDVCVNGQCQPVGCDMMLGSDAREDQCRVCRGNGTSCHTTSGLFNPPDLTTGYTDILLIPKGSTNILIEEIAPSNNNLVLRSMNGTYYLNGNYRIDLPKSVIIAGALWHYEREHYGLSSPDKLRCLGPTKEPLYLSIYLLEDNVGINYKFSVPNDTAPPTDTRYKWTHGTFATCNLTCGGGYQLRNVTCRSTDELEAVDDALCDEGLKPASAQPCNTQPCAARWEEGPWGNCSQRCGEGGVQARNVTCERVIANGLSSLVNEHECFEALGPKPKLFQKCNEDIPCPKWFVGPWKKCDKLCGEGIETRQVICHVKVNGRVTTLQDDDCGAEKPEEERPCIQSYCDGVDWVFTKWSTCDSCLSTHMHRQVMCVTNGTLTQVVEDSFCSYHNKPPTQQPCGTDRPTCEVMWYATQWGKCSVECGDGVQERRVFCGMVVDGAVVEVNESSCDPALKYRDSKPCSVPLDQCPSQWYIGAWPPCPCDSDKRRRVVLCIKGQSSDSNCPYETVEDTQQFCKSDPCSSEAVKTSRETNKDGIEYCADGENPAYPEEGLEEDSLRGDDLILVTDTSTSMGTSFSGSTPIVYAEAESSLTTEESESGSGFEGSGSTTEDNLFTPSMESSTGETDLISDITGDPSSSSAEYSVTTTDVTEVTTVVDEKPATKTVSLAENNTMSSGVSDTGSTEKSTESTGNETTNPLRESNTTDGSVQTTDATTSASGSPLEVATTTESVPSVTTESNSTDVSTEPNSTNLSTEASTPASGSSSENTTTTESVPSVTTESNSTDVSTEPNSTNLSTEASTPASESSSDNTTTTESVPSVTTESNSTDASTESNSTNLSTKASTPASGSPSENTTTTESVPSVTTDSNSTDVSTESNSTNLSTEASTPASGASSEFTITTESVPSLTTESNSTDVSTESNSTDVSTEASTPASGSSSEFTPSTESVPSVTTESNSTDLSTESDSTNLSSEASTPASGSPSENTTTTESIPSVTTESNSTDVSTEPNSTNLSTEASTPASESSSDNTTTTESVPSVTTESNSTDVSTESNSTNLSTEASTPASGASLEFTTTTVSVSSLTTESNSTDVSTESNSTNLSTEASTPASGASLEFTTTTVSVSSLTTESNSTDVSTESNSTNLSTEASTPASGASSEFTTTTESVPSVTIESNSTDVSTESNSTNVSTEASTPASGVPSEFTTTTESITTESNSTDVSTESNSTDLSTKAITTVSGSSSEVTKTTGSVTSVTTESNSSDLTTGASTSVASSEVSNISSSESTPTSPESTSSEAPGRTAQSLLETSTSLSAGTIFITSKKPAIPTCIPRPSCKETEYGCCPDRKTAAKGPFDLGCHKPRNCHETVYSCCPDGVTPAQGDDWLGCPPEAPCAETLYGCCPDNKTAAVGNDQEGCPDSTLCNKSFNYGCCADNKTEALGPDREGCPEKETTVASTPTTSEPESSIASTTETSSVNETGTSTISETSIVSETGTSSINETGTSTISETSSVSQTGTSSVNETGTSTISEISSVSQTGTSSVTETETSTISETSNVSETGTSSVTETGTSPISETSSVSQTGTSSVTETETSTISETSIVSETGTSSVNETETSTISETSSVSQTGTSSVTETSTISETSIVSDAGTSSVNDTGTSTISETSSTGEAENSTVTETETSTISETSGVSENGTSSVTETGTSTISETSGVSENGTSSVTETGTSTISETSTTTVTTELTTVLEGCSITEFGCCYDNETAASGTDGLGCPCNATEFGCCPDGESPAEGPEQKGCRGDCKSTQYGCCSDGETPAHGPDAEGCCLLTAFGCCPDNRQPAEGPQFQGCRCQSSQYGCCPDGVTAAEGPDNKGCGCQYTQHGCCPDRHTEATGPQNEGCPCSTYQYGCCPDGVIAAKGPQQLGCHCRESPFKCCGDGQTPANSADGSDCSCAASKYGCCPDGTTTAAGPKFLGCTDIPENKQAACHQPMDSGKCHNYTVAWFYDTTYGGCTKFWYNGCEGNGNRFATKEICEDICVQPAPKDACKLPAVKGACDGDSQRWYYDSEREQCTQFRYGGCLGNANNFDTRELCQVQCEPDTATDVCSMPIEHGSCAGNYSRWGFNQERGRCEQFAWGGCEGNANRFHSEAACRLRCSPPGMLAPRCTAPQEAAGDCADKQALWSFSQTEGRCVPFYYSGCGGNDNRFSSRASCEQTCPSAYQPNQCTLPHSAGDCDNYRERWFYDTKYERCRQFWYGGCGGNTNNFETLAECESTCSRENFLQPATTTTTVTPKHPEDICQLPMATGPCGDSLMRWFYNTATDSCSQFTYGGCEGNDNRFESREACENRCQKAHPPTTTTSSTVQIDNRIGEDLPLECEISKDLEACSAAGEVWFYNPLTYECVPHENQDFGERCRTTGVFRTEEACLRSCGNFKGRDWCTEPMETGACTSYEMKVYYNQERGACEYFEYRGCSSSANRFSDMEECEQVCAPVTTTTTTTITPAPPTGIDAKCIISEDLEACSAAGEVWFYNPLTYECVPHENQDFGQQCRTTGVFPTEEACLESCQNVPGPEVCRAPLDVGTCQDNITMYYWDLTVGRCERFSYGGCDGGPNRFSTIEECERVCRDTGPPRVCLEQVNTGSTCREPSSVRYYYDPSSVNCVAFAYQGCGGNGNNFGSYRDCTATCLPNQEQNPEPARNCTTYDLKCDQLRCQYDVEYSYSPEGCVQCACSPPNCEQARQYCDTLAPSCPYGVRKGTGSDGCESCECYDDPCASAQCSPTERCVAVAYRDPDTQEPRYSAQCEPQYKEEEPTDPVIAPGQETTVTTSVGGTATLRCIFHSNPPPKITWRRGAITIDGPMDRYQLLSDGALQIVSLRLTDSGVYICVADNGHGTASQEINLTVDEHSNEIGPCEQYTRECTQLSSSCEFGVQRAPAADGCTRCTCAQPPIDCAPFRKECEQIKCAYGIDKTEAADGCPRCRCASHPCAKVRCAAGESCAVLNYRDAATGDPRFTGECRRVNKPGMCPAAGMADPNEVCRNKCKDDSNCRGDGKCCQRGCSRVCLRPVPPTAAPVTVRHTTRRPELPRVPEVDPRQETNFESSEGGTATLRCLFHSNPPPKISWRRGEITIDGTVDRYRLLSDGALQIVSLFRNDSGVYMCVADNGLGTARKEVRLTVSVPVGAHIRAPSAPPAAGGELSLVCEVDGYPEPEVRWYKDDKPLYSDDRITISGSSGESRLTIVRLEASDGGLYGCHVRNDYSADTATTEITVKQEVQVPARCTDNPYFANCALIVRNNFCRHKYYGNFCCKSCVEAGQLAPEDAMQADQPVYRRK